MTAGVSLMHPWCTLVDWSGSSGREARAVDVRPIAQLVAAELLSTAALAAAIALSASTRGVSSNSSITWP